MKKTTEIMAADISPCITVYDMRTESTVNPLGLDKENPAFSWKIRSNSRGTFQTAYQIIVAKDEDFTQVVWDTGRMESDQSLGIVYRGEPLEPCTRYFWKVNVWVEKGDSYSGDVAWFETGLMGTDSTVWNHAKWIGSPKTTTNTAALNTYMVSADFQVEKGNKAGFVVAARNKDNYVLFEVDMDNRVIMAYEYCDNAWGGSYAEGNRPAINTLGSSTGYIISEEAVTLGTEYEQHNLSITVNDRDVTVAIDGVPVINNVKNLMPSDIDFQPRKNCLMSIGFKQEGSRAVYDNLIVMNTSTGDVYQQDDFSDDSGAMSILGQVINGKLVVENAFEITCPVPAVNVKNTFDVSKEVKSARLYASARGFYNVYINGKKVGGDFFNPGFTDYRLRIQYQTFDVTDMLKQGKNMIGAIIGKGLYSGYCGYSGPMQYGSQNSFIAQLVITYADGSRSIIVTDESWKYTDRGPVIDSDYLDGENYDARLEFNGWGEADDDDYFWGPCGIKPWPSVVIPTNGSFDKEVKFQLSAQYGPTAQIERKLTPVSVVENPKGHFVYDFGQNMVGTIRLTVKGERGASLKIRYGEMSYKNGEIYIKNVRSAANTDTYTLKGDPNGETFIPSFTSHGFRYVEITGNGYDLADNSIVVSVEGLVLTNIKEITGGFESSNELVNKLQSNIQWGQRGNFLLIPTDCPQRNERMGWTGDAQIFAATAAYNMDVKEFMRKWLQDLMDAQLMYNRQGAVPDTAPLGGDNRPDSCAGWADAAVIVPWEMYQAYGDIRILEECYDMMAQWIAYQSLESRQNYGVRIVEGKEVPEQSDLASIPYIQVQQCRGDHLAFDESTPYILSATSYAAYVAYLMSSIAEILGKDEDAARYRERFEHIKRAYNEAWVKEDGSLAYWGEMSKSYTDLKGNIINRTYYSNDSNNPNHPSQTAYALAIDFGLIPKEKMARASECLAQSIIERDYHLSVGFLGISHLNPALTKAGLSHIAFKLLEQKGHPGWLYSVLNGATTIWERWNSYVAETDTFGDVSMNSFNHYSFGAIGEWMYKTILGINSGIKAGEAGYKKIVLTPTFGGSFTYAKGWHESPYGRIESGWTLDGNSFIYTCTVPANTCAILYLPADNPDTVVESGVPAKEAEGVTYLGMKDGKAIFELKSGRYAFASVIRKCIQ